MLLALKWNLLLGWTWMLLAFLSGAPLGLRFHDDRWQGGYASWRRRLLRLAHVSWFGLGSLNLLFAFTFRGAALSPVLSCASACWIAGGVLMPACCYLAAWKKSCRAGFPLPVAAMIAAVSLTLFQIFHL